MAAASLRHKNTMFEALKKLEARFGSEQVKTLSGIQIKEWLSREPWAMITKNKLLGYIRNAWNIVLDKGTISAPLYVKNFPRGKKQEVPPRSSTEHRISSQRWESSPTAAIRPIFNHSITSRSELLRSWSTARASRGSGRLYRHSQKSHLLRASLRPWRATTLLTNIASSASPTPGTLSGIRSSSLSKY
jgi:hypothetical protein